VAQASSPQTTEFADINPDNEGPLAGQTDFVDPCPEPCASQHNGGRVNGLAAAAGLEGQAANTYYAASEVGGLFKTVDDGGHWEHLDAYVPNMPWDSAAEQGGLRVFTSSFFDGRDRPLTGVEVSANGGATWSYPTLPFVPGCSAALFNQPSGFGIALRPGTEGEVFVGTNCGLARSLDHGDTWARYDPTPGDNVANSVWDVVALAGGRTYACGDDGLLISSTGDAGTWQKMPKPVSSLWGQLGGYCSIAVSPHDPKVVFAIFANAFHADITAVGNPEFFEGDIDESGSTATITWTQFPYPDDVSNPNNDRKRRVPFAVTNDRSPGFDPADPSAGFDLWVADGSLWRIPCHDGQTPRCPVDKTKWKGSFSDDIGSTQMAHGDSGDLEFDPRATVDACPTLYSSDGGVYANALTSTPGCQTPDFRGANVGLHAFYLRGMAGFRPSTGDLERGEDLYIALQDNGLFYTSDGGAQTPTWVHGVGADIVDVAADDVNTLSLAPATGGLALQNGDRGFTHMHYKLAPLPSQPLWDSEILVPAGSGHFLLALYTPVLLGTTPIPRGVRDIDMASFDTTPLGTQFGGDDAPWPANADWPCHIAVGSGPSGPVPYVLAGKCWYGMQNIGVPSGASSGKADQLWTLAGGKWERRMPGPRLPGEPVSSDAGFSLIAVDPTNPLHIYASVLFDGAPRMMWSTDGGVSWTWDQALSLLMNDGFEPNLGDPGDGIRVWPQPSLIAFDPYNPNIIVAGGRQSGVFISSDGGGSWAMLTDPFTSSATGIPHLPNPAFAHFDHDKPGVVRVYLGTGRGVWRIALENANLAVAKADTPDPVLVGANLTFNLQVTNAGPDNAQNATLEDRIPTGTRFQSVTAPAGWTCMHPAVNATGALRCSTLSMRPGTATITLVVRVVASVDLGAGVQNTARVFSAAVDPNAADNLAGTSTAVWVPVAINIKPGGFPNSVNLNGQATVAVLTTSAGEYGLPLAFDARSIDSSSVRFGPAAVVMTDSNGASATRAGHLEDSIELDDKTKDGDVDMTLQFRASGASLSTTSTQACIKGSFDAGGGVMYTFFGCDSIKVVP